MPRILNKISAILTLGILASSGAWAISEGDFSRTYWDTVYPFYKLGVTGSFVGQKGLNIAYWYFKAPAAKAAIVISPGFAESHLKYAELAFDLAQAGYSVYVIDHRCQVDDFNYSVDDLKSFHDQIVLPGTDAGEKVFLLAHSMGGLISGLYLERYPNDFTAVVLGAPMFRIQTGKISFTSAYKIAETAVTLGLGETYVFGQGDFDPDAPNTVSESTARHSLNLIQTEMNPGTIMMGGISYGWLKASLVASMEFERSSSKIRTPTLMFQAGKDSFVEDSAEDAFLNATAETTTLKVFPEAHHEIFQERDEIRSEALGMTIRFFDRHLN